MSLKPLTLDAFRATAAPVSDALWAVICEEGVDFAPREAFTAYDGEWVLHEADGKWWPHAWWYKPVGHATRESAEADLHAWRNEFV